MEERSCLGPCWSRCRVLGGGRKRTPPGQGSWEGLVQSPHTATCRASGESGSAENAGSGECAQGSWGSRRAVLRPEKASGIWGRSWEELQADPRTRPELGQQHGRERVSRGERSAGNGRAYWKRAGSGSRSMKSGSTRLRYCCQH